MKRGFTMIEMLLATLLVGVLTTLCVMTFNSVTHGWQISTEYMDKMQRTDFALEQIVSGLRSAYYPHNGKQDDNYGFVLTDNGNGETPDKSDVIEWSKKGAAIVGKSAVADTVHRVQVKMCEEGETFGKFKIDKTGLYARMCIDKPLKPKDEDKEENYYTFENEELYEPLLIADGICGFNCRVLESADKVKEENDKKLFEDEYTKSNSVPYKVELTFRLANPEGESYRSTAPVMRIVRMPIHEQSQDGATTPQDNEKNNQRRGGAGGGRK